MNIHEHWRESFQTCPTFQGKFQPPPAKIQTIDLFFVELHVYTYTELYTYHMYIYIYSSHVFLRYRGLNLWKDTLYIWFDAKRNNVFPLDCSFKPSEFGWFQVWTVSPGFVGEEHNHCYWFPHKQCHFMWMFPFFRPNLIDKTLLFAKTISNPMFWLIESHSSIFVQLQIIFHQLKP